MFDVVSSSTFLTSCFLAISTGHAGIANGPHPSVVVNRVARRGPLPTQLQVLFLSPAVFVSRV
jgi:hypothetical protein